eukprot:TRINITY_DN647_c0_g1_i3.p1 TRINITY_DN647_c0_g1~~TRINITY_DN647_c0_g1_i3.p1  ORF type:complete len:584 (-),score=133.60 TRINITY_DN647_c0_g1_i3:111-1790(-)
MAGRKRKTATEDSGRSEDETPERPAAPKRQKSDNDISLSREASTASTADVETKDSKDEMDVSSSQEQKSATPSRRTVRSKKTKGVDPALLKVDWRELTILGVELDNVNEIHKQNWSFPELIHELNHGELAGKGYPLYMWMGAQPVDKTDQIGRRVEIDMINLPYIVVVDCKVNSKAFDRVATASIQASETTIKTLKEKQMSWVPYVPKKALTQIAPDKINTNLKTLSYEARAVQVSKYGEEKKAIFGHTMPYILLPQIVDDFEQNIRNVSFVYAASDGQKIEIAWDKDCMRMSIDIEGICDDYNLNFDHERPLIVKALTKAFEDARTKAAQLHKAQKDEINCFSAEDQEALRNIKCYKFYPTHSDAATLALIKGKKRAEVNRFYGHAYKVFPVPADDPINENQIGAPPPNPTDIWKKAAPAAAPATGFSAPATGSSVPATGFSVSPAAGGFQPTSGTSASSDAGFKPFSFSGTAADNTYAPIPATKSAFSFGGSSAPSVSSFSLPTGAPVVDQGTGFQFSGFNVSASKADQNTTWTCASCSASNPDAVKVCAVCDCRKP